MGDAFNIGALVDEDFDDEDPLLVEVQVVEKVDYEDVAAAAAAAMYEGGGFGVDVSNEDGGVRPAALVHQQHHQQPPARLPVAVPVGRWNAMNARIALSDAARR